MPERPRRRTTAPLVVDGLSKSYGHRRAVREVSFGVHAGSVTGLVGPPDAGKSTVLRMVAGITRPDAGTVLIDGERFASTAAPAHLLGVFLSAASLPADLPALSYLEYVADSQGLDRSRCTRILRASGIGVDQARRPISALAPDLRQGLGVLAAILAQPQVIVLDDPVRGLSRNAARHLAGLLHALADDGATILVSSRPSGPLIREAARVILMAHGAVVGDGTCREDIADRGGHA